MDIDLPIFDTLLDKLVTLHYYFLFFIVGMMIAFLLIKREIKLKRNEQLNRIFFGAAKKEE